MSAAHTDGPGLAGMVGKTTFHDMQQTGQTGKVYLIGAGPGAADLITVLGARLLEEADAVLHDALVEPAMLDYAPPRAQRIAVGKRCAFSRTPSIYNDRQEARSLRIFMCFASSRHLRSCMPGT
jgi:hypothetical protein